MTESGGAMHALAIKITPVLDIDALAKQIKEAQVKAGGIGGGPGREPQDKAKKEDE